MEQKTADGYIAEGLNKGVLPEVLKQNLIAVGWSEEEAGAALVSGLIASGVPIPKNGPRSGRGKLSSTVEVVMNFFSFLLLTTVAIELGTLYYQIINNYFPDPLALRSGSGGVSTNTVHYAIASLIIAFPIYVLALRMWFKRFREDLEKVESKLTKWLTYLVLLVTAVTIIGDLITALFYLLQGEITPRFFLKALTILVIAGIIFGFYFLERKKIQYHNDVSLSIFRTLAYVSSGLVVVAIIFGFIVGGSPATERMRGLDTQRANDLRTLANCIANYGATQKALPKTLDDLSRSTQYSYCSGGTTDPETGTPYEYRELSTAPTASGVLEGQFELCANFALDAQNESTQDVSYAYPNDKWSKHGAGRSCSSEVVALASNPGVPMPPTALPVMK